MSNKFSQGIQLAGLAGLTLMLGACVSNPSDMANTINTVGQVAGAAQGLRGGGVPGGANALAGGMGAGGIGGNSVDAMRNAQGDPRFARAEEALKQLNYSTASCKDMQAKKQATLNSLAEVEPLTANLMFKQLHERLRIQNDSMGGIANAKKCKLPTVATINANGSATMAAAATPAVNYSKLNCSKLKTEYSKLTSDLSAAEAAEKANAQAAQTQGGIAAIAQIGAMMGGNSGIGGVGGVGGMGNAQQVQQMAQLAGALSGAAGGAAPTAAPAVSSMALLQQKTDLESAASKKRCNLGS